MLSHVGESKNLKIIVSKGLHCTGALSENSCCEDKFLNGGHQHLNINFQQDQQWGRMAASFNGGPY